MPKQIFYRIWCKRCNEFTLHYNKICKDCDTEYTSVYLSDIPNEKLLEQRERYVNSKVSTIFNALSIISDNSPFGDMKTEVVESDAGQITINEKRAVARKKKQEEREELLKDYNDNYRHLGRNDKCGCGSGKKYKHCCYAKFTGV